MTMIYDVAAALMGKRTDGQSDAQAGAYRAAATVRHGTAQAASADGWVDVLLDGSDEVLTMAVEADVSEGQRVSAVSQAGVYKVVSLGDIPGRLTDVEQVAGDAKSASATLKEQMDKAQSDIEDARKVATNFITQDTSGITISDVASTATDKPNVNVDAYGVRVRHGSTTTAEFAEVTTLGKSGDYRMRLSSQGQQLLDKTGAVIGTLAQVANGASLLMEGSNGVNINGGSEHAGDEQHISMGGGSVAMWTDYGGVNVSKSVDSSDKATGKIDLYGLDTATLRSKAVDVKATSGAAGLTASGAASMTGGTSASVTAGTGALTLKSTGGNISIVRGSYTPIYANADGVRLRGGKVDLGDANIRGVLSYNANWQTGFCVRKCGPIVIIDVSYTLAADIAAGGYYQAGTISAGYRPSSTAYARGCLECTDGGEAFIYVTSAGLVRVYSSNGLEKGSGVNGQVVYFAV